MKSNIRILILICLAVIATISINLNYDTNLISFQNSNSFIWIPICIMFFCLLKNAVKNSNKRLNICVIALTLILTIFQILGKSINMFLNLDELISSKVLIIKTLIFFIGYFCIIYVCLIYFYKLLEKIKWDELNNKKIIKSDLLMFLIVWIFIFIAYIPYFLTYYPGNLTPDSMDQISQSLGLTELKNHHPVFHTSIISIPMMIGSALNNHNLGVAIFSIMQMLFVSGIFAFSIYYMRKKGLPLGIRVLTIIFYAIYPVHGLYSITMWKDIPFAVIMLVFTIFITRMSTEKEQFFNKKRNLILTAIIMILVVLFRNNGIYVLFLLFPFAMVFFKKYYKKIILVFAITFLVYFLWKSVVFKIFNISDGSVREALSIPLQQIARTVREHQDSLTEKEKNEISNFFIDDNIGKLYSSRLSDPVKSNFDDEYFKENKIDFIKLWIGLFFKYPLTYVESFLCNSYGYWYPEASNWVTARGITASEVVDGIYTDRKIDSNFVKIFSFYVEQRDIPILSMFCSIGFAFWMLLISLTYCIYIKKYNLIIIFIPMLALWLTNLASPVFCEFRYIYSLFTSLPILLTVYMVKDNNISAIIKGGEKNG